MTTTTEPRATRAPSRTGMPGLLGLVNTEFRLYTRDFGNIFFVLFFPTILLLGVGFIIPGMREPITDGGPPWLGLDPIHLLVPVMIAISIATAGLAAMPVYLAGYREKGILRRLSTTPMAPQGILLAQVVTNVVWLIAGAALALVIGFAALGVPAPVDAWMILLAFPLAVTSIFGIGLIIGGIAAKATVASGIGMTVYFPMLFFAGMWTPGPVMPDALATIATWTPLGAASQVFTQGWFGGEGFPNLQFISMALWTVVTFVVAAKTFRWR